MAKSISLAVGIVNLTPCGSPPAAVAVTRQRQTHLHRRLQPLNHKLHTKIFGFKDPDDDWEVTVHFREKRPSTFGPPRGKDVPGKRSCHVAASRIEQHAHRARSR